MSAPAPSPANQLYLGPSGGQPEPVSLFSYIWNEQIMNPAHREGNLKCVFGRWELDIGVARAPAISLGLELLLCKDCADAAASPALSASSLPASSSFGATLLRLSSRFSRGKLVTLAWS